MGADLIISEISIKKNRQVKSEAEYFAAGLLKVKKAIEEKPIKKSDWKEYYDEVSGDEPPEANTIKQDTIEVMDNLIAAVRGKRRDAVLIIYPERTILVSGGMSWGDMPTDLCNDIYKANNIPKEYFEGTAIE